MPPSGKKRNRIRLRIEEKEVEHIMGPELVEQTMKLFAKWAIRRFQEKSKAGSGLKGAVVTRELSNGYTSRKSKNSLANHGARGNMS